MGEERKSGDGSQMVSFQIPAHWMPWIERERVRRGLRTRSDFFRRAVHENLQIYGRSRKVSPETIIIPKSIFSRSSPSRRTIRVEIHDCLKRGVMYFSKLWGLVAEREAETLQLATRTYRYLLDDMDESRIGATMEGESSGISDDEKKRVLSASGTAVKAKLGEIGLVDDPIFGEIPEVLLTIELSREIDMVVFIPSGDAAR